MVDWKANAQTSIGEISRTLRFTAIHKNLKSYRFTVTEGREAKCCQPWYDPVENINDPQEILGITKLNIIKTQHGIVNALKIVRCVMCKRQTPGFDIPFSEISVLEGGKK